MYACHTTDIKSISLKYSHTYLQLKALGTMTCTNIMFCNLFNIMRLTDELKR
jgi:hypothetical protein